MTKNNIIDIILLLILFVSINYLTYKDKNRNMFSFKYLFILFIIYLIPITFMMFDRDDDIYSSKNLYSNMNEYIDGSISLDEIKDIKNNIYMKYRISRLMLENDYYRYLVHKYYIINSSMEEK